MVQQQWEAVQESMGIDLEQTARETKALQRVRAIRSAGDLLRLIMFYALSGWGLRLTGAWALLNGIGYLSDVAILKRLRNSCTWLGKLVALLLQQRCSALRSLPGVRLRILDATCISHAGSDGIDWRVHLSFDVGNLCIDSIEVTDRYGGENLSRCDPQSNEIVLADSGYAFASGMGPLLERGAGAVIRINWRNVAVCTSGGQRFHIIPWLKTLSGLAEHPVWVETPQGCFPLRLIACPIPAAKAEQARRRVHKRYQRKQRQVSQETLFAAGFVLLLTNLPPEPWSTQLILFLYRTRWQIELVFKRLKSLLYMNQSRTKDPRLTQTCLLAVLLLALLIDHCIQQVSLLQLDWFISLDHPVNPSRLTLFFKEAFRQLIVGSGLSHSLHLFLCVMQRYFCDPPRHRPQQLALVRALFLHICSSSPFPLS